MKKIVQQQRHALACVSILMVIGINSHAQQFNSDSWLSKAHGTVTIIPTIGQRNSMLMTTYSLFPKWEFTVATYLYNDDNDPLTNDGHSATIYGKYMIWENRQATGGFAVKAGTGLFPGTLDGEDRVDDAFKTYWMNAPATIPLFKDKFSLDLMPGASMTLSYGDEKTTAWAFTYSTRLAYYPFSPKWSAVGEIFGAAGEAEAIPEYKLGVRWEPNQYSVIALTYGQEFNGTNGAGFEFGVMLFTPPFACLGGCNTDKSKPKKKWKLFK